MEFIRQNKPGFTLRDRALSEASFMGSAFSGQHPGDPAEGTMVDWVPIRIKTPHQRGVSRYETSPEIAARDVKVAARFFGAGTRGNHQAGQALGLPEVDNDSASYIFRRD